MHQKKIERSETPNTLNTGGPRQLQQLRASPKWHVPKSSAKPFLSSFFFEIAVWLCWFDE